MTRLQEILAAPDIYDDAMFCEAIRLCGFTDRELARKFGMSVTSAGRWRSGNSAPHPAMRKPVYEWLKNG